MSGLVNFELLRQIIAAGTSATVEAKADLYRALAEIEWNASRPKATSQEEDRLLDMPEVARLLGVPEDRAYDLGRKGELPVVTVGKYRRVRMSALTAYIRKHEEKR